MIFIHYRGVYGGEQKMMDIGPPNYLGYVRKNKQKRNLTVMIRDDKILVYHHGFDDSHQNEKQS